MLYPCGMRLGSKPEGLRGPADSGVIPTWMRLGSKRGTRSMMADSYIALDLETTGIGAKKEKITEIGMAKVIEGQIVSMYHTMVNPYRPIPEKIVQLTGIDDSMVQDAPGMEEILDQVLDFIEDLPILGHQISFDYGFLVQAAVNQNRVLDREGIDTLKLCRLLMPAEEKKNLGAACRYFGIKQEKAHRALSDAISAHLLYQKLMEVYGTGREDLFSAKKLQYRAKKERTATKRQKNTCRIY